MKQQKMFGLILLVVGAVLILSALYIKGEVKKGRQQIAQTEFATGTTRKFLSSQGSNVQRYGDKGLSYIDDKVSEGKTDVHFYEKLAYGMIIVGAIGVIVGIYVLCKKQHEGA
ncbi:MAG: hypothetical protein AAGF04_00510 [Chlamydiota bacterium]